MFYRVDYMLAVLFVGFLVGVLLSKAFERVAPYRLAQGYYVAVAALLVLRTGLFACTILMSQQSVWAKMSGGVGDLINLIFGALFGVAVRRKDARELLTTPLLLRALCMGLAFTFATNGAAKAFSMTSMTEFFTQSGYSVSFLKFIMIAEIFGALGLLLPWAVLPSLLGLAVDMFGAVLTHIHNGDPLNDSTGAIGMLIRLAIVGVLWALNRRTQALPHSIRNSILSVGAVALACLLIALGGGAVVRHVSAAAAFHTSH
ncbi:DoxX family protein [Terriglobus albidus]|uniref:DoxX family protein n=1 Tax=Terriglobus albidus TaxID=1592106 RepID=A0A5B9EJB1_9BACT|nr:DoxX family protein [Terriglobus albidus]QEE30206.1 DoxX family protein [Terriglobus albidus]